MAQIDNDWLEPLKPEFAKPYYKKLYQKVIEEYNTHIVFPEPNDIFNAFALTPLHKVKAVILGQDPYHGEGQAHGLCFSVKPGVDIPPSLLNIYKELQYDMGCEMPNNGYAEYRVDCSGSSSKFSPWNRMGRIYRRCNPDFKQTRSSDCIPSMGKTGTDEKIDVK